jgi:tRNA pseudouridine13 synthase
MSAAPEWTALADLPYAFGGPPLGGRLRATTADFQVEEVLGFEPDGEGEHALLLVRKIGLNTDELARQLARLAGLRPRDVGYCGLKDRNAVTSQWFSLGLAGREEPDWAELDSERVQVLGAHRHRRKLRRGAARGNRFRIRITDAAGERDAAEERLTTLRKQGAPNYFGEQRFGRDYGNLERAEQLFQGTLKRVNPHQRGLYLSAARSQIFNELLAQRVRAGSWSRALPGDLMQLEGSHSWFPVAEPDAEIARRVEDGDIQPTGPLWGRGAVPSSGLPATVEQELAERFASWCHGLERFGLKQDRRSLRVPLHELEWAWGDASLEVGFRLPSGCYATSVLRELVEAGFQP